MNREETVAKIRAFVSRFFRGHELRDDEDMFAAGFVNSMFAMQLVQFVEQEFAVTVEDEDLDIDNFRSLDALAALVARKTAPQPSPAATD
ncbi:MAG TPA: acyl carrier protein [Pyrinomonadaceae bacterium]|jgi:acyl carrier protein